VEDLRAGAQVFKFGDKAKAVQGLVEAAEKGNAFALWRLGRMYADGDGVEQDKLKAFELFSRCADDHAFDGPDMPQSHFVANAYVALGRYYLRDELQSASGDGSVIVVIATDAPLSDRNLERLARRAFLGIARTGSPITNGSGDYAIAFSTAEGVRRTVARRAAPGQVDNLPNDLVSPLFEAVVEATEEAVLNSMFRAETAESNGARIEALPLDQVMRLYRAATRRIRD